MSDPIILWNPIPIRESDDAGNDIIKTTLAPPTRSNPKYTAYDPEKPRRFRRVPGLASFCIRALSMYPEQLHQLGSLRLYFDYKKGGTDSVLRAVLPKWRTPNFSILEVDPRSWATVIQIYKDPPYELDYLPCQLSDPHVPLLGQIPMTPDFTLLTLLCLANSRQLTDDNVLSLKVLHNLAALDVSNCTLITAHGIRLLSRTLMFNEFGEKRGPWALRILRMRSCWMVDSSIFDCLQNFPLLTAVDLSDTRCRAKHVKEPFTHVGDDYDFVFCYHLIDAISDLLETHENMFPNETPKILSLQDRPWDKGFLDSWRGRADLGGCRICNGGEVCYCNDSGYCEGSISEDENFAASSRESEDEDLCMTSLAQCEGGAKTGGPLTEFPLITESPVQGAEQRREPSTAVSANKFYQPRPPMPHLRLPWGRIFATSLRLFRVPPTWSRLDSITPQSQVAARRIESANNKARSNETNASIKRKRELPMQALQSELVKRHKPLSTPRSQADTKRPSPPPSPTATLCNINDSPERQRPTLRPISNLQPPPRPAFEHVPRLKLDPAPKDTRNTSSKPAARFSAVAARGTSKPRNMSILEGFKNQTRKYPSLTATGASRSEGSGRTTTFQEKPISKSNGKSKPSSKEEEAKGTSAARQK